MKKIIITLVIISSISLGVIYYLFKIEVEAAEIYIENADSRALEGYNKSWNSRLEKLKKSNQNQSIIFDELYSDTKPRKKRDTLVSFFLFSEKMELIEFDGKYIDCAEEKSYLQASNQLQDSLFTSELNRLLETYGQEISNWALKDVGSNYFFSIQETASGCKNYFEVRDKKTFLPEAVSEFHSYVEKRKEDIKRFSEQSKKVENQLQVVINRKRSNLSSTGRKMLDKKLKNTDLIMDRTLVNTFEGKLLGVQYYEMETHLIDSNKLDRIVDQVYTDQYRNNSLRNGAMPYAYCYGSSNSCSGQFCSQIKVVSPSNSDVLVSIKKDGIVYRHGYVKAGNSLIFNMPNGTYQTFFYYGKGWDPNKFMKETDCGTLNGGFLSNETFGKDDKTRLNNNILTYELVLKTNGNFSTKPSDKNEAF